MNKTIITLPQPIALNLTINRVEVEPRAESSRWLLYPVAICQGSEIRIPFVFNTLYRGVILKEVFEIQFAAIPPETPTGGLVDKLIELAMAEVQYLMISEPEPVVEG